MQEDQPAVFGITDPLSTRYGNTLTGTFVAGHRIALSTYRPITSNTRDKPTEYAGQAPVYINFIQPEFIFDDAILRSLIAEANSTFVALQALKRRGSKADYTKISRTYRSIIRACLEKLQDAASTAELEQVEATQTKYQQYISTFYSIECIWHLCEILFMDPTPANVVVPQLLDWIRFHFPAAERTATDLLLLGRDASDSDEYWPTLKGLILQGQVDVTRALLQLHPLAETAAFKMSEQILKAMPTYNVYGGFSIQKFRSQWQYWLTDTERKLAAHILSIEPNLEELIKLVTGDTPVWNAQIKQSQYWYEYLPGYLFYTNPACKHFELGSAANTWLDRWDRLKGHSGNEIQLKQLDRVILNLMENDMHRVIHALQLLADNQWFVTHLTDLLYNCGQLQIVGEHQVNDVVKLRETLLYEFGSCLMTRNALWQLGMDYLEYCSQEGQAALELLLTKIAIRTEKHALKILEITQKKGFNNAEQEICKVQAKRSLDEQRYGNALEWAIRSKDTLYVTSIADFLLNHYAKTGDMLCPDVIANIGAKMFISPRLVFLVKYFDFYQFYRKREFLPAAELLVNLLESKITPEYVKKTNAQQFSELIKFMEEHPEVAKGPRSFGSSKKKNSEMWELFALDLNSLGPPTRNARGWNKVWLGYKLRLKHKIAAIKRVTVATGGGPYVQMSLSPLEQYVDGLLGLQSAVNASGIVFGGISSVLTPAQEMKTAVPLDAFISENFEKSNQNAEASDRNVEATPSKKAKRSSSSVNDRKNERLRLLKIQSGGQQELLKIAKNIQHELRDIAKYERKCFELKKGKLELLKEKETRKNLERQKQAQRYEKKFELKLKEIELKSIKYQKK